MSNRRRKPSPGARQVMHASSVGLKRSAGPPFFFLEQSQKGQRVVVSVKVEAAAGLVAAILEVTSVASPLLCGNRIPYSCVLLWLGGIVVA